MSTKRRFPHPYKGCFVLLPNQCGTSQKSSEHPLKYSQRAEEPYDSNVAYNIESLRILKELFKAQKPKGQT